MPDHPEDLYQDWAECERLKAEKRSMTIEFNMQNVSPEILERIGFDV